MKSKKYFEITEELTDNIISVAYGDAGFFEKVRIYKLAREYPEVKSMLNEYSKTAKSVHSIKKDECPDSVLDNIVVAQKLKNRSSSFLFDIYTAVFSKPAVSAIAVVVFAVVLIVSVSIDNGNYNGYTQAEIEQARQQTKQALALVSGIFSKTEDSIKNDILVDKISKPINNGVKAVNDLFIDKEKKNEN
jgi:hypothetical protein